MDPDKAHQETLLSSGKSVQDSARRRSNFSLSFALRSPRNRASVLSIDTPEPQCQERLHYPIYNPQDPRHNPSRGRRHDSQHSSSDSQKQARWVQDLQKRSIHKVRSGIVALREGFLRLSSWNNSDIDDTDTGSVLEGPRNKESEKKKRGHGFSGISDTSTQEDVNFGVGINRTNSPWPPASREPSSTRLASSLVLTNVSAPEVQANGENLHHPEPGLFRHANFSTDELPPYTESYDRPFIDYLANTDANKQNPVFDTERSIDEHVTEHLDRTDASDWETIASGKESASSVNEDVSKARGPCDPDNTPAEQRQPAQGAFSDIPTATKWSKIPGLCRKVTRKADCPMYEQGTTNTSTESFKLSDPDAPSSYDSSKQVHPIAKIRDSEALVTQEPLRIHREMKSAEAAMSSISMSSKCPANVKIAFPGLYHALVEQWETHNNLIVDSAGFENNLPPSQVSSDAGVSGQPQPQHLIYDELPWSCENRTHGLPTNTSGGHKSVESSQVLSSGEQSLTGNGDIWAQAGRSSRFRTTNSTRSSSTAHSHPPAEMPASEARHSSGLHIAQRNKSGLETTSNEPSQQAIPEHSFNQQTSADNQYASLSALATGGPLGSPFDLSDCSSIWTNASSISPGATSRTSMSNIPWSPIDSPVDEEVLFSNNIWRNEYYMADGKASSFYPDRGDQPVKRIWRQRIVDDGSIHSGPGLDRTLSSRLHVSELMAPMTLPRSTLPRLSQSNRPRLEREGFQPPEDYTPGQPTPARRLG